MVRHGRKLGSSKAAEAEDRSEQDLFGESVDFGGSSMIAGSRVDDDTGLNTGTVYVIGLP